jgi:hypothetical protein
VDSDQKATLPNVVCSKRGRIIEQSNKQGQTKEAAEKAQI